MPIWTKSTKNHHKVPQKDALDDSGFLSYDRIFEKSLYKILLQGFFIDSKQITLLQNLRTVSMILLYTNERKGVRQRCKCEHMRKSLTGKKYKRHCKNMFIKLMHFVYTIGLNIISGISFNVKV